MWDCHDRVNVCCTDNPFTGITSLQDNHRLDSLEVINRSEWQMWETIATYLNTYFSLPPFVLLIPAMGMP